MAALPSDIAAASREAVNLTWQSATIKTRYPGARDQGSPPAEGFFDTQADAQAAIDQRGALLGVERRRFTVPVQDVLWIDPTTGLPTYQLVDSDQAANMACIPARFEIDLEDEATNLELFG
ncbi:hypothetical protein [Sphingomonas sp. SRS2]|uniref:hypothetical protein n=1 Tax=Sphingomonas sp. SRS2 TaxID=133190 RepID=UPI0006184A07|nr:hypothetical protein [Sphingomonas sp. SRS2]KKC24850.1 hypothetical protein WP12_16565 [Sphingomonas sp. SRS2]